MLNTLKDVLINFCWENRPAIIWDIGDRIEDISEQA